MTFASRISWSLLALVAVAGCASTKVTQTQSRVADEEIPRPDRILVYDFGATAADVAPDSVLAGVPEAQPAPTADQIAEDRELGVQVAQRLVDAINAMGMPAYTASPQTRINRNDIVIHGYFASIDPGSAAKRMLIGFGAGAAELKTVVEVYQMTPYGLRKLGSGDVSSGGGKGPGAVVPAAVAIATANPIGLIVTSAVKIGTEASGISTIEGRAKATAQEIANELKPRMQQRGWID